MYGFVEAVAQKFLEKGVLSNFTKFTRKHLCYFPVNFVKFPRTPFLREHLRCLFLDLILYFRFVDIFREVKRGG